MCGIIAYLGDKNQAGKLVVEGLKKLEYRGYDSFGFAEAINGKIKLTKKVGKISEFKISKEKFIKSALAAGHTRWATHGGVKRQNAHPQISADGKVVVVHNGIVENHEILKKELKKKGVKFSSETDTEVIPNLISQNLKGGNLKEAVRKTARKLHGRYAFVAILAGSMERWTLLTRSISCSMKARSPWPKR